VVKPPADADVGAHAAGLLENENVALEVPEELVAVIV
jgi:hypothetical protein